MVIFSLFMTPNEKIFVYSCCILEFAVSVFLKNKLYCMLISTLLSPVSDYDLLD